MSIATLQDALGYVFTDRALLIKALTHRSYASEHANAQDNERLEFVGDAVLQLVVTEYLYGTQTELQEGEMAKVRAGCVNRDELAGIARSIGLGNALLLGVGERQSNGAQKASILADAMEAILAAVYVDGGMDVARRVILDHWRDLIDRKARAPGRRDYKTRLQERLASAGDRPSYQMGTHGPDHARTFTATVSGADGVLGAGTGASKKEAQQAAARVALEHMDAHEPNSPDDGAAGPSDDSEVGAIHIRPSNSSSL